MSWNPADEKREDAKRLLMHYLQHAARGHISAFTSNDGYFEVGEIVDLIVEAAMLEVKAAIDATLVKP